MGWKSVNRVEDRAQKVLQKRDFFKIIASCMEGTRCILNVTIRGGFIGWFLSYILKSTSLI